MRIALVALVVALGAMSVPATAGPTGTTARKQVVRPTKKTDRPLRPQSRADRQRNVANSRQQLAKKNPFNIRRGLGDYGTALGPKFGAFLLKLGKDAHWIDAGAGLAYAQRGYVTTKGAARMTAVVLAKPKDPSLTKFEAEMKPKGYRYLSGRPLEKYTAAELGRAELVTDVYGPAVYASNLGAVMNTYLSALKPGGRVYLLLDTRTTFSHQGKPSSFSEWVKATSGVKLIDEGTHKDTTVTRYRLAQNTPPQPEEHVQKTEFPNARWYVIERTAAASKSPTLTQQSFVASDNPIPRRHFDW